PLPKGPNNGYSAGNLSKKVLTLVYINGKLKFGPSSLPSSALKAPVPIVGKAEAPPGKAVPVGEARIPSNPKAVKGTTVTLSQEQRLANGELIPKGSVVTWSDNAVKVVRPDGKKRRFNSRDWEQKALPKPQLPKDYRDDINIGGNNPRFNQQRH
ncbi:adhesin, partial [Klebsiella pneumoniae]|nr:adhesin [Klebsiella pneumoniae]